MHESARFRTLGSLTENIKQSFSQLAILVAGTLHASLFINQNIRSHERLGGLKDK
jgi:hypothetical protein